ncbi:MAG: hypothetical protein KKB51_17420 [Candidatus Riflebacteria bacterium]|nr:hypothetical protein [Candidatus Riflebacteria bacterium]
MRNFCITKFNLYCLASLLLIISVSGDVIAQQDAINRFTTHVESKVNEANALMENKQIKSAVEALNDVNRYIEHEVGFNLEDQFFQARKENPSFNFNLRVSLAGGFASNYWKRKYDFANSSLASARSAVSGFSSMRTLDKQDQAWAYLKTTYEAVKTVKDVLDNVRAKDYLEAIKTAKEGVDGFIENYKEIEETYLQKIKTGQFELLTNGLIRRANRAIRSVEPILSFMKANAEEGERFESLLKRVKSIQDKVLSGAVQEMVFGDSKYTWNYGSFLDEIKESATESGTETSAFKNNYQSVKNRAKASWQLVQNNIRESNDERQKPQYLEWAKSAWEDFETQAEKVFSEALSKVSANTTGTKKDSAKPNLFAGISKDEKKSDSSKPAKPNLFAGLNDKKEDTSEDESEDVTEEQPKKEAKLNLFAGSSSSGKTADSAAKDTAGHVADNAKADTKSPVGDDSAGKKLGSVLSNGAGDNSNKSGGTYLSVDLNQAADEDIIVVRVTSGLFKFVHIHLRNSRGIWYSIYNGTNTMFRVGDLIKDKRGGYTHINICVNGQHVRHLPIQCSADIYQYKNGSIPANVQKEFAAQWQRGSGEIPNEFMNTHASLWLGGKKQSVSVANPGKSSQTSTKTTQSSNSDADKPKTGQSGASDNSYAEAGKELIPLVTKVNGIIKRADDDFNKKYWEENGQPQTTQKATNPKASTLSIMREAMSVARSPGFPENRITLSYKVALKLLEYSGRVFVFVGKEEFFVAAAALINDAGGMIDKVKKDKVSISFLYSDHGEMWRTLGKKALVGGHGYNKNECYKLEVAAYERALSVYSENYKAKRALGK